MQIKSTFLFKLLLTCSLFINLFNSAYACWPTFLFEESIEKKAEESSLVFDGVVTGIYETSINSHNESFIKVRVEQYFKGAGLSEVKIAHVQGDDSFSCADFYELGERALFFAKGNIGEKLEAVADDLNAAHGMDIDNFRKITATKECMATYDGGVLSVPCIAHKETKKVYKTTLDPIATTDDLKFSVNHVQQVTAPNIATECMATYDGTTLLVPCIAHGNTKKIYQATLDPISTTGDLKFSVSHTEQVTNVITTINTETFDYGKAGTVPNNWKEGITGKGVADWTLEKDSTAPSSPLVLKQSGKGDYPWCVKEDSSLTNGFVTTKFKTTSGSIDQAAGLVWRWKDADNYYVARANALEDNISIYYMKDGQRHTIKYENVPNDLPVKQNVWQTLRVDFQGDHFIVSFEGKTIVNTKDDHIKGKGAVGLWTKEDSVTFFDDFSYGGK